MIALKCFVRQSKNKYCNYEAQANSGYMAVRWSLVLGDSEVSVNHHSKYVFKKNVINELKMGLLEQHTFPTGSQVSQAPREQRAPM